MERPALLYVGAGTDAFPLTCAELRRAFRDIVYADALPDAAATDWPCTEEGVVAELCARGGLRAGLRPERFLRAGESAWAAATTCARTASTGSPATCYRRLRAARAHDRRSAESARDLRVGPLPARRPRDGSGRLGLGGRARRVRAVPELAGPRRRGAMTEWLCSSLIAYR